MGKKLESSLPEILKNQPESEDTSQPVAEVLGEIEQNLLKTATTNPDAQGKSAESLRQILANIIQALILLATANRLTKLSPALAKFFMCTALVLFVTACDDQSQPATSDASLDAGTEVFDANTEDFFDSSQPDTRDRFTEPDLAGPDSPDLDEPDEAETTDAEQDEVELPPEITEIIQEDLVWTNNTSTIQSVEEQPIPGTITFIQ